MRISLAWLRDFVELGDRTAERIAADLTLKTALIEGIERKGELAAAVVVGRVVERKKHPGADRLSVCQVDVGSGVIEIVCGAPNVAAGQTVAVATTGAELPGGLKIKRSKIRGVESNGMICSEVELGLGEDHDGILVLEAGLEPGRPFRDVPGVTDAVLEIDNKSITHRPDLWGHEGFARELAAIYDQPLRAVKVADDLTESTVSGAPIRVDLVARDLCGRYHALVADGPFGGPAPALVKRRLTYCGLRPLGLAVDLSNYVMLEIGQPTHPFDRELVRGGVLRIRRALADERIVTLDGVERLLPADACVIADAERGLAVAGLIGGKDSGIRPETKQIVLESAWFDPVAVRRTSVALGLRTDALARFEKHLDPRLSERALRRFAALVRSEVPGAVVGREYARAGDAEQPPVRVRVRPERVRERLGSALDEKHMAAILDRLGFGVTAVAAALEVEVPSFRATRDVRTEEDLIEEIGRIHGYDSIPARLPRVEVRPRRLPPTTRAWRRASEVLRDRYGFSEVLSHAFQDDQVLARAGGDGDGPWVELANPQQQSARRLRRSLVPWLLEFVDRNVKSVEELRLFECGRVFHPGADRQQLPAEPLELAAVIGERVTRKEDSGRVLRRLKGAFEDLAAELGRALTFRTESGDLPPYAHPGRAARLVSGDLSIGWLAQVHPRLADAWNWRGDVAVIQVDLERWLDGPRAARPYAPPARFPVVWADISFVARFELPFAAIESGIRAAATALEDVELVDEYSAPPVPEGARSLTVRVSFRSKDRTLTDHDLNEQLTAIRRWLAAQGVVLRGDTAGPSA